MSTYINKGNTMVKTDQLFVYGIFLDEDNRLNYGMSEPRYDTVPGFVTFGNYIVTAVPVDPTIGVELTGLVVDVDPSYWGKIDALERDYERIVINTSSNQEVYMYAAKGTLASLEEEEYEQVTEA